MGQTLFASKTTQHNTTQHNTIQHNTTQHNTISQKSRISSKRRCENLELRIIIITE